VKYEQHKFRLLNNAAKHQNYRIAHKYYWENSLLLQLKLTGDWENCFPLMFKKTQTRQDRLNYMLNSSIQCTSNNIAVTLQYKRQHKYSEDQKEKPPSLPQLRMPRLNTNNNQNSPIPKIVKHTIFRHFAKDSQISDEWQNPFMYTRPCFTTQTFRHFASPSWIYSQQHSTNRKQKHVTITKCSNFQLESCKNFNDASTSNNLICSIAFHGKVMCCRQRIVTL